MSSTVSRRPQSSANVEIRTAWSVWIVVASIGILLFLLVVAAPVAAGNGLAQFASATYKVFGYLCHQLPERSFHFGGHKFAVCSRCTGLYAGFALATLSLPLVRSLKRTDTPQIIWLVLSVVPLSIDFALTYFGVWENNHFTRVMTGALFGAVAAIYVVPGLIELAMNVKRRFKSEPPAVAGG